MTSDRRPNFTFLLGAAALTATILAAAWGTVSFVNERQELVASSARYEQSSQAAEATKTQLQSLTSNPSTTQAFQELDQGYRKYIPEHLRDLYVHLNPFLDTDRGNWNDPKDGSLYTSAHALHHPGYEPKRNCWAIAICSSFVTMARSSILSTRVQRSHLSSKQPQRQGQERPAG